MKITFTAFCETGNREGRNQDSIFAASDREAGLFLVADGMGGHSDGAFASRCVREETESVWVESGKEPGSRQNIWLMEELCSRALEKANHRIRAGMPGSELCGSTAVLLSLGSEEATLFSCGDSRCYLMRSGILPGKLRQLSKDDVWENSTGAKGCSRKEIKMHKNRGKLMRAVGTEKVFSCFTGRFRLSKRNVLMLCSDGIYKYLPEKRIVKVLRAAAAGKAVLTVCAESLRDEVYRAGAPDNISLILILAEKQ